jgi:hypothetical protein
VPKPDDSPLYDLAELRLGENLVEWLRTQHAAGKSWSVLSVELYERTGRLRVITPETLRKWARQ